MHLILAFLACFAALSFSPIQVRAQDAGHVDHLRALLDEIGLENFAKAAEAAERLNHLLERLAPGKRCRIRRAEDGLHDLGDVIQPDVLVIDLGRCAEGKILDEEKIDLVAIRCGL